MEKRISAEGFDIKNELKKYTNKKLSRIKRRVPRKSRATAKCDISFSQVRRRDIKHCTCTIVLTIDDMRYTAKETTTHMYAALDIASVHIEQQLRAYRREQPRGLLGHRLHTL